MPLIREAGGRWYLSDSFSSLYNSYSPDADPAQSFRAHVDDVLDTGLALSRLRGTDTGELVIGRQYSRRQVCRMLGWDTNQEGVINGYKVDTATSTCPIFVTYDGDMYNDHFKDNDVLHWYTRLDRTLVSPEIKRVLQSEVAHHLFVEKSDQEGKRFYYLGCVDPHGAANSSHGGKPVVTMDLVLRSPVEEHLYRHLSKSEKPPTPHDRVCHRFWNLRCQALRRTYRNVPHALSPPLARWSNNHPIGSARSTSFSTLQQRPSS
ncbi:hypothetical protein HMPREF0293_0789 [Corynebacterium glucuronolyticum ATCC 51866]|uniref:DUF3427 domain-containing protein n=2 Tax=Corynebacterium glucuronolyticum TaxID=39791 RepID=A0ABP2DVK1_9CORY|nr:hypothetical protein HMPREF0293_0789 [Corynebacterium glucuronolyticum ATCC 51866]